MNLNLNLNQIKSAAPLPFLTLEEYIFDLLFGISQSFSFCYQTQTICLLSVIESHVDVLIRESAL